MTKWPSSWSCAVHIGSVLHQWIRTEPWESENPFCLLISAKTWKKCPSLTGNSSSNWFLHSQSLLFHLHSCAYARGFFFSQSAAKLFLSSFKSLISYHFKMTANGPMDSSSHIACFQPEVTTEHACMHLQHSHLSRVWSECHLREPAQRILRTHVHENELPHWYFLVFKFRHIFFLPLWKYRLAVDIFFFYLGMLTVGLYNRFLISSIMKVVVC